MINYITGTLGAGKSMYGARLAGRALLSGKVVATNVRFVDGWVDIVLSKNPYYRMGNKDRKRGLRDDMLRRYAYVPNIWELLSARLHGRGEGRGVMLLDEAHNEVNNRNWADANQQESLNKLTLARKRGWHTYVISQHIDNTDAAIRRIATVHIRCLNWQQMTRVPVIGISPLPFPIFLAQAYAVNQASNVSASKRLYGELYRVGWYARLYDTHEDFDLNAEGEDGALWLPRPSADGVAALAPLPSQDGEAQETDGEPLLVQDSR